MLLITMPLVRASAQATPLPNEPVTVIDNVLKDLSAQLKITITRGNTQSYTWEQQRFPDAALGCPAPGVSYAQVVQLGYIVTVKVRNLDTIFEYRSNNEGTVYFQCKDGRPVTNPVTVATAVTGAQLTQIPGTAIPGTQIAPTAISAQAPLSGITAVTTPTTYNNPLAFVGLDGNVYVTDYVGRVITSASPLTGDATGEPINFYPYFTARHTYMNLVWSPDGTRLAFTDWKNGGTLYVASSGQKATAIANGLAAEFPPAWSSDGGEVAYAVAANAPAPGSDPTLVSEMLYQIQAVPATGGAPRAVGQFGHGASCGGGNFDSSFLAYTMETGVDGNNKLLAQVAGGYLFTRDCAGLGLGLTTLNNPNTWKQTTLSSPALSPDRTRVVAIVRATGDPATGGTAIHVIDARTGEGAALNVPQGVFTRVAWSADGQSIFYTTQTPAGSVQVPAGTKLGNQFLMATPAEAQLYTVELWRVPAAGGTPVKLYSREARGFGNILTTPDGSATLVSVVTSQAAQFQAINNPNASAADVLKAAPRPEIIALPQNGTALRIVQGGKPAIARGQFVAIPATITAASAPVGSDLPPPALVIGGKAVVTVVEGSLNLRANPSTTATVRSLLPKGTVITIVSGPTSVEGFRWWEVRTENGNTGWVVDQVSENGKTTNALTPQ